MDDQKTWFIVQARMGSTRLPGKVMMEFPSGEKLMDIITNKIRQDGNGIPMVVATSDRHEDDPLAEYLVRNGIECYRGPDEDVVERFIQCAAAYEINTIIRICADNPFIDIAGTLRLLEDFQLGTNDYVAYSMAPGLPSIKSHVGLWGEVVSLEALLRVREMTHDQIYREHVTNYIYGHPELFRVRFLDAPENFYQRLDIRLTLDDLEDMEIILKLLSGLNKDIYTFDQEELIGYINKHPEVLPMMKAQIMKYQK